MFSFGKKSLVGIDIGTASIKLVELSRVSGGHFQLETYGIAQLTYATAIQSDSPLVVTINTLKELMKRSNVKTKKVVASLPTSTVFVTVTEIPKVSPKEQR